MVVLPRLFNSFASQLHSLMRTEMYTAQAGRTIRAHGGQWLHALAILHGDIANRADFGAGATSYTVSFVHGGHKGFDHLLSHFRAHRNPSQQVPSAEVMSLATDFYVFDYLLHPRCILLELPRLFVGIALVGRCPHNRAFLSYGCMPPQCPSV